MKDFSNKSLDVNIDENILIYQEAEKFVDKIEHHSNL